MNKKLIALFFGLIPGLLFAQETITFSPPAGDYSVMFLGNIFGNIGGILHGSGSQIMGEMFAVFNAAVMALGMIILFYTTTLSTMNTAHEGQALGKKWDSMWVPVRSTMGLALLVPKASGYCLMQQFVMWLVLQGVGAADKVWDAALNYMSRGGVIVSMQPNPATALLNTNSTNIVVGAAAMLTGQVCMLGLQRQLENQREIYLNQKESNVGPCYNPTTQNMTDFCNNPVPDFLNSINFLKVTPNASVTAYGTNLPTFTIPMPNETTQPYKTLNGVCGQIQWNEMALKYDQYTPENMSQGSIQTLEMTRTLAVQQMFNDLASVARMMVANDPQLKNITGQESVNLSNLADQPAPSSTANPFKQPFGVPLNWFGQICEPQPLSKSCTASYGDQCTRWGLQEGEGTALFTGQEFWNAVGDYNNVMAPTLNYENEMQNVNTFKSGQQFISEAGQKGWLMAGSYFFDLVNLNQLATQSTGQQTPSMAGVNMVVDTNSGLQGSSSNPSQLAISFDTSASTPSSGCTPQANSSASNLVCELFNNNLNPINDILNLISANGQIQAPNFANMSGNNIGIYAGTAASTTYGYINNAALLTTPSEPCTQKITFPKKMHPNVDTKNFYLKEVNFSCGRVRIVFFSFCLGQMMGSLFYNDMFRNFYNAMLTAFNQIINQIIMAFLMIPLEGMATIFKQGMDIIDQPGVNPVVALAQMGTFYINFAGDLWVHLIELGVTSVLLPIFGAFVFVLIGMAMPIILAWLGTMVSIGFITAYYVPLLPYMIFTFGSIAWFMAVIEAMVAAPIVALGITHPEGHETFGKGEHAVMIWLNVFLRPAMMIIGYIAGIALSYVGVWILNAGFNHAVGFIQGSKSFGTAGAPQITSNPFGAAIETKYSGTWGATNVQPTQTDVISGNYSQWAGIFAYFFSIMIYTWMYWTLVEKAFNLITMLPDKVLRWVGGQQEGIGQEAAGWTEQGKQKVERTGEASASGVSQTGKMVTSYAQKGLESAKEAFTQGASNIKGRGT